MPAQESRLVMCSAVSRYPFSVWADQFMDIANFDNLMRAALAQPEPQRLLFVFAGVELPDGATTEQIADFEHGHGGVLVPLMCVDKAPDELTDFRTLVDESDNMGQDWRFVFVAALSGRRDRPPASEDAAQPLERMVEAIKQGRLEGFVSFDRGGQAVQLSSND